MQRLRLERLFLEDRSVVVPPAWCEFGCLDLGVVFEMQVYQEEEEDVAEFKESRVALSSGLGGMQFWNARPRVGFTPFSVVIAFAVVAVVVSIPVAVASSAFRVVVVFGFVTSLPSAVSILSSVVLRSSTGSPSSYE
jgi:hypothetical protein